jgi:hypothetical protein
VLTCVRSVFERANATVHVPALCDEVSSCIPMRAARTRSQKRTSYAETASAIRFIPPQGDWRPSCEVALTASTMGPGDRAVPVMR